MDSAHSLVLETLQRATSQNLSVLKPAENKLQEWETEVGFYSILKNIFCNHNIDNSIRLLAVLCCKNGVDKYWRKTAPNAISEEEKANIRTSLISDFTEPVNQIATQLALLIAKIARFDCPHEWSELLPALMSAMKSNDYIIRHRSILILHHVVKSLSSKRLAGDKRMFYDFASNVFPYVYSIWESSTHLFYVKLQENIDEAIRYLEVSILALKILEKLVVHGFTKPHESQEVNNFLKKIFEQAKSILDIRPDLKDQLVPLSEKFVIRLINVLLSLLERHPFSFVDYIRPSLEFTVFYSFTPEGERFLFERFLIQCFNLIKALILCPEYRPAKIVEETKDPETLRAHQNKLSFFTSSTLTAICRRIVTHYFILTSHELQQWENDPEEFAMDEGGEAWRYTLRPSIESLFVTVFHEYHSTLAPVLVNLIQDKHGIVSPDDFPGILAKDAIYNAIGLTAFDMCDEINFDDWFTSTLCVELATKGGNYRILRRRIAMVLAKWIHVKLSCHLHSLLYSSMIPLLEPSEDMVVRIMAANTIRSAVDDFEFNTVVFLEYLEPIFCLLFTILKEAQQCDTKMRVLHVLRYIIERVNVYIEPYFQNLMEYLPILWHQAESPNMLRCAVVTTLVHLVEAIESLTSSSPENELKFVISVISVSTDVNQDCHVYLLEDGLELWQAVVENIAGPSPPIMQLFNNMPPLLERGSEHLRCCMYIIRAYVLLAPEEFLMAYGSVVVRNCGEMLVDMRSEGVAIIMRLLELCVKANPSVSISLLQPLLPKIFEVIHKGEELPMIMSIYLSLLARILLVSKEAFIQATNSLSEMVGKSTDVVLRKILDVWLEKMPLVTKLERRKLLGIALASLITSQSRFVYDKFCEILVAIVEVLNDVSVIEEVGIRSDSLIFTVNDLGNSPLHDGQGYVTEHDMRKKRLAARDIVHTLVLENYFRTQLEELKRCTGPAQFDQLMQTVDPETISMVREYVQI